MIRFTAAFASILILLPAFACAGDGLSVGPIRIGMHEKDVLRALGSPRKTEVESGFIQRVHSYDGISIQLDEDLRVAGIESTSALYCLDGWLCPRADFRTSAVKAKARKAELTERKIVVPGDGCWAVADGGGSGLIEKISISCQP